jgi:hypothetical protein
MRLTPNQAQSTSIGRMPGEANRTETGIETPASILRMD